MQQARAEGSRQALFLQMGLGLGAAAQPAQLAPQGLRVLRPGELALRMAGFEGRDRRWHRAVHRARAARIAKTPPQKADSL